MPHKAVDWLENMEKLAEIRTSFWPPLTVVILGAFMAILNNSSINVALPKLMTIYGVPADEAQWVLTAYMLVCGVVVPVTGYLGDSLGVKRVYTGSLAVFILGSLLCSFAWSNGALIAARVVQGIGGGAIMPVSMAIVYRIVPREKIGLALGIWGLAAVFAPAVGPTLGGYIIDHFSWHLLFTMNIPVGLAGILLGLLLLPEIPGQKQAKADWWGFITCAAGCFTLLLALSQGQSKGWSSYYIVSLFTVSFFSLLLFTIIELTVPEPMLDLRLFKNGIFTVSVFAGSVITIGLFGGVFLMPLFTQNLLNYTPYQTGLLLMPSALVTAAAMPLSGIVFDRFGARGIAMTGLLFTVAGTWELHSLNTLTSRETIIYYTCLRSLGMGLAMMPITTAGMNTVSLKLVGRASAMNNVIRQIAGSFGIVILTATMQHRQAFHYARLREATVVNSPAASLTAGLAGMLSSASPSASPAAAAQFVLYSIVARESLARAIGDTFLVASLIIAYSLPLVFFLKGKKK